MKDSLRVEVDPRRTLRIFIAGAMHLSIMREIIAVQSWLSGEPTDLYSIEYTIAGGENIITEYEDRTLWLAILAELAGCDWSEAKAIP